jgi:hypothetical protein
MSNTKRFSPKKKREEDPAAQNLGIFPARLYALPKITTSSAMRT